MIDRPVAVVAGALANKVGNGGEAWVRPSWVLGLADLGFDTWLVEELAPCSRAEETVAVDWFRTVCGQFGLGARSLLRAGARTLVGPDGDSVADLLDAAVVVFDISGHLGPLREGSTGAVQVYVDLDPGFTQFWAHQGLVDLGGYDAYVTVGTAIGSGSNVVPTDGIEWIPTNPPVLMDRWRSSPLPGGPPAFTTVGSWRPPHGCVDHAGVRYGVKAHEFRRFVDLPSGVDAVLRPALSFHPADRADEDSLRSSGFDLVDPRTVAGTPSGFAEFLAASWGEWSVAQGVYVHARTGWVSDRSAHYLASGRPVICQDTGSTLPVGEGFLTFTDAAGAAQALRSVLAEPAAHAAAARGLAERHLDARPVLAAVCERIGVTA